MIKRANVEELESLIAQLHSLHIEMTALTKKSSTDAVNAFKLRLINKTLERCNSLLGKKHRPFDDFDLFDGDDVPSNSDVTLILGQYQAAVENYRSENVTQRSGFWFYALPEGEVSIRTVPPSRLTIKKG